MDFIQNQENWAVIYTRITEMSGKVTVTLLTGKAIKTKLSILRLELCGAVLASKLIKIAIDAISIKNYTILRKSTHN